MSKGNGTRTKGDETGHSEAPALSAPQAAAVELLAVGKTDTEAAEAIGVTRQTVNGWRNHDPAFLAAVNARRRELWEETHDRLRGLATKALDVLAGALEGEPESALPAAVHVLKALGIYGSVQAPGGPVTEEAVLIAQAEAEASRLLAERPPSGELALDIMAADIERPGMVQEALFRIKAKRELEKRAAGK